MKIFKLLLAACMMLSMSLMAHADELPSDAKTNSSTSSDRVPVSTGKYITGGVLGTTLGFGIGHGVQGRWHDRGWIFTTAESIGTAALIAGLASCKKTTDVNGNDTTDCSDTGAIVAGYGVLLGFHIWEIVDVWTGATPVEDNSPKAFLIPNPKAPGIGVAWSF